MSSEKFEDLEDELKTLLEDISNKVTNKIPRLTGGKLIELINFHLRLQYVRLGERLDKISLE